MREKITKFSWACFSPQTLHLYLEQTKLVCQLLALIGFFPICKNFSRFFVTFGTGPDILMNVLEDCIIFLIWTASGQFVFKKLHVHVFIVCLLLKSHTWAINTSKFYQFLMYNFWDQTFPILRIHILLTWNLS